MSAEKIIGYMRDAGCVLVGLGGIVYQIVTGETNAQLLGTCMGLLGIAGGIRVWQLRPSNNGGGSQSSSSRSSGGRSQQPSSADGE